MRYRQFGRSTMKVSELAFGAMGIAHDPNLKAGVSRSLLYALEHGVNLIDTARIYPGSESIIASTLREWTGAKPGISTKLASSDRSGFRAGGPVEHYYSEEGIVRSVDASLRALGVERLDIVHLHQWHYRWTHELSWLETLQRLQAEGKVGLIAVSAQDHEHDALLELVGSSHIDGIQTIINLFESRPMNALLPHAANAGVGVIARCVLDSGGLTRVMDDDEFRSITFLKNAPAGEYQQRVEQLRAAFIPAVAPTIASLAMRFALSHPAVSCMALGLAGEAQVKEALDAVEAGSLPAASIEDIRRHHVWTKNFYERLN